MISKWKSKCRLKSIGVTSGKSKSSASGKHNFEKKNYTSVSFCSSIKRLICFSHFNTSLPGMPIVWPALQAYFLVSTKPSETCRNRRIFATSKRFCCSKLDFFFFFYKVKKTPQREKSVKCNVETTCRHTHKDWRVTEFISYLCSTLATRLIPRSCVT